MKYTIIYEEITRMYLIGNSVRRSAVTLCITGFLLPFTHTKFVYVYQCIIIKNFKLNKVVRTIVSKVNMKTMKH